MNLCDGIIYTRADLGLFFKQIIESICKFLFSNSGKTVKKEPGNEEGQQPFDDADKLLQEFQEAQVDRVGSRPSSNLSSLSNASERDQHHLGNCSRSSHASVDEVVKVHHKNK